MKRYRAHAETNFNRAKEPATADDLDRETRRRFTRIETKSSALLQEFWPVNQTASTTGEISQRVLVIQEATRESVMAIQEIAKAVTSVNEIATVAAGVVEEERATMTEITRNIQDALNNTHEVSRNIIEVTEPASSSTGHIATQVLSAASALNSQAEGLRNQVDDFFANPSRVK